MLIWHLLIVSKLHIKNIKKNLNTSSKTQTLYELKMSEFELFYLKKKSISIFPFDKLSDP